MTLAAGAPTPLIQLPEFEGPLDLLLALVERRRLPIAELSLALVADQYLAQVRSMAGANPEPLSEFLPIGSRLLLLKSRALLPQIEPPRDAEAEDLSPEDLVRRLEVYRTFKLLAGELSARFEAGGSFTRGAASTLTGTDAPPALRPIAKIDLFELLLGVESRGAAPSTATAEPELRTTVTQRLTYLRERLGASEALDWREIGGETVDQIVATLLAVLELVRRGEARVLQPLLFGPIRLLRAEKPTMVDEAEGSGIDTGGPP